MSLEVRCSCGAKYRVNEKYLGKSARCKDCGSMFLVKPLQKAADTEKLQIIDDSSFSPVKSTPKKSTPDKSPPSKSPAPQKLSTQKPAPQKPAPQKPATQKPSHSQAASPRLSAAPRNTASPPPKARSQPSRPAPRPSKPSSSSSQGDDWDDLLAANLDDPGVGDPLDELPPPVQKPKPSPAAKKKKAKKKPAPRSSSTHSAAGGGDITYGLIYLAVAALFIFGAPFLYKELDEWEKSDQKTKKINAIIAIGYQIGGKMGACFASVGIGLYFVYSAIRQFKGPAG